jgi:KipI family sensor histidine kinase inhibitor
MTRALSSESPVSYRIAIAGENAFMVYLGQRPSEQESAQVQAAVASIDVELADLLVDLVPSYASILVIYDVFKANHRIVLDRLKSALQNLSTIEPAAGNIVSLPVYYDCEVGPDLEPLASQANLSIEQLIELHQSTVYRVYAIGFAPGFAYLGDVDKRIACPRLATPRLQVPRGAVGIADRQTAVYPAQSPGGWNLIGRCPQRMFDANADPSMPVRVGDRVQFEAISRKRYLQLGGEL